jgi:hypothetical protein
VSDKFPLDKSNGMETSNQPVESCVVVAVKRDLATQSSLVGKSKAHFHKEVSCLLTVLKQIQQLTCIVLFFLQWVLYKILQ